MPKSSINYINLTFSMSNDCVFPSLGKASGMRVCTVPGIMSSKETRVSSGMRCTARKSVGCLANEKDNIQPGTGIKCGLSRIKCSLKLQ